MLKPGFEKTIRKRCLTKKKREEIMKNRKKHGVETEKRNRLRQLDKKIPTTYCEDLGTIDCINEMSLQQYEEEEELLNIQTFSRHGVNYPEWQRMTKKLNKICPEWENGEHGGCIVAAYINYCVVVL